MSTSAAGTRYPELGFYTLPGHVRDPRPMLDEICDADRLGLGSVWISERPGVKEAATLCGAAAATTKTMAVATGVTNTNTRHLVVTASYGATMSALTNGRFCLGLGRGLADRSDLWNVPRVTQAVFGDTVALLRRVWAGETIRDHRGPAGTYGLLTLGEAIERPPTLGIAALGPRTQEFAGRMFDVVLLHSHWTDQAVADCVERVRRGAERAGRDPDQVQVWSVLVTACDLPEDLELQYVIRRMTTYMQRRGYGELIVDANGWDPSVLERIRDHPVLVGRRADTTTLTVDELRALREAYPDEWIRSSTAVGSGAHCAARILDQFAAGASGVVLHASAPEEMSGLLEVYGSVRQAVRFTGRSVCPGSRGKD